MEIREITPQESEYPKKLLELRSAPKKLYVCGKLPDEERVRVGIVGARECSAYGKNMAYEIGARLAQCGVQVISGMARGIDGAAQKGALEAGGYSLAVLGCGVDVCYPREHRLLHSELQKKGGVLSEQPCGASPLPQYFPARNRIISGLSDVILIIEAKEKSGSLITADMALEQGKDVYALPGPINSDLSKGCNKLIKQGAGIVVSIEDFLEELLISPCVKLGKIVENKILLETTENIVYACFDFSPKNLEAIVRETNLSVSEVVEALLGLEIKGYIKEISKNYYVKLT